MDTGLTFDDGLLQHFYSSQSLVVIVLTVSICLLDELLGLEVLPEVEHLPRRQGEEAAHGEDGEVEDARVGGLVGVPHLFLALAHVGKVLHDRLGEVLQPGIEERNMKRMLCCLLY